MVKIQKPRARGKFVETETGLVVPPGYIASGQELGRTMLDSAYSSKFDAGGFAYGTRLERDPDTMVVRWSRKGSGLDDRINQAIADGTIANAGISPVLFPQLTALVKRRQSQALTASVVVTGRKSPAKKVRDAIARFNDSPLGAVDAIRQTIYQIDVFNRGAPIATVPIVYPTEQWGSYGLKLRPLGDEKSNRYWLEVNWSKYGTPIPFLPNVFDLEPTGNHEFPYWFKTDVDGNSSWILLHNSQIISLLPSWTGTPGIGTSAVYATLGFLGEHVLVIDERYERMIDQPSDGIVVVSGVAQSAKRIRQEIENEDPDGDVPGAAGAPSRGWTIMATPNTGAKIDHFPFRQGDGVDFEKRRQYFEDILALCFEESLSAVVTRGGLGYGAQSETAANSVADSGVFAILQSIGVAFSSIYPKMEIAVSKINDRARSLSLDLLNKFSLSVAHLPPEALSIPEMRAIIDRDILTIPVIEEGTTLADAASEEDKDAKSNTEATGGATDGSSAGQNGDTGNGGDSAATDGQNTKGNAKNKQSIGDSKTQKRNTRPKNNDAMSIVEDYVRHLEPIVPDVTDEDLTPSPANSRSVRPVSFYRDYPEYSGMLDARIDEFATEPEEGDDWVWYELLLLFALQQSAKEVDRERALEIRDDLAELRAAITTEWARLVAAGQMTPRQWQRQMERLFRETTAQQFMLGAGGRGELGDIEYAWLDDYLDKQFGEIRYLAERLQKGLYSEAQLALFGANLIRRAKAGYEAGNAAAYGVNPALLPAMPGDGSSECMGACHCWWEHLIDPTDGEWLGSIWHHPPVARMQPGWEPCNTCYYRINAWVPWVPGLD